MQISKLIACAAVLLSALPGQSANFYVATNGSDAAAGTIAAPFRTIQWAASVLSPGDICWVIGGLYRETVIPARSGTAAAQITFQNCADEVVTITGMEPISNWSQHAGAIWTANIPVNWFSRATPGDGARLFDPTVGNESDLVLCDGELMPLAERIVTPYGVTVSVENLASPGIRLTIRLKLAGAVPPAAHRPDPPRQLPAS